MKKQLEALVDDEKQMDECIQELHKKLNQNFLNNEEQTKYTYLTYDDFKALSKTNGEDNQALFIITAPKGTTLEVPVIDNNDTRNEYPYQLFLNSKSGEIQVYICTEQNQAVQYE